MALLLANLPTYNKDNFTQHVPTRVDRTTSTIRVVRACVPAASASARVYVYVRVCGSLACVPCLAHHVHLS